ncbi:hypothetical protein [Microvirga splendida]|uniref:Uncharacterized protein n=1 Tax=Microvirga splendida TaxID=2795727 RepID=A0ABS0XXM5_9HYPH|nr:hypothetical protein [Microvirga splendida]MBJ6124777.1 hypothetical protein [Microvirga splendida]
MSDYAFVADRARRAFASVARLESALARAPEDSSIQINLAAKRKLARQAQEQLYVVAERNQIEICNYRLLPEATERYALPYVSKSLLEYQNLFSQIYDSFKNGLKARTRIGKEAWDESLLELAYSYSGSLGVVLLATSERDFFEGKLDNSIDALFQILEIDSRSAVRDVAHTLGNAVVKRLHDWSAANIEGGFATDVRWNRSDGKQLGQIINRRQMEVIVDLIEATSDEQTRDIDAIGLLVGGDLNSGSFHFVVPNGSDYRGYLADDFFPDAELTLGKTYIARIRETSTTVYATEKIDQKFELLFLKDLG